MFGLLGEPFLAWFNRKWRFVRLGAGQLMFEPLPSSRDQGELGSLVRG